MCPRDFRMVGYKNSDCLHFALFMNWWLACMSHWSIEKVNLVGFKWLFFFYSTSERADLLQLINKASIRLDSVMLNTSQIQKKSKEHMVAQQPSAYAPPQPPTPHTHIHPRKQAHLLSLFTNQSLHNIQTPLGLRWCWWVGGWRGWREVRNNQPFDRHLPLPALSLSLSCLRCGRVARAGSIR